MYAKNAIFMLSIIYSIFKFHCTFKKSNITKIFDFPRINHSFFLVIEKFFFLIHKN